MEQKRKTKKIIVKKRSPLAHVLRAIGTLVLSVFLVFVITGSIFGTVLTIYILNFADTTTTVTLERISDTNITRFLYEDPNYDPDIDDEDTRFKFYYCYKNDQKHFTWVDIDDVPQHVKDAFVYTEDERFYNHDGVDFKSTIAAFVNIFLPSGSSRGGSTITQQTIKNLTGDNATDGLKGIERKIREVFRAINVEKTYTKDDILQSYLNVIPQGTSEYDIIGIQASANFYFGKDVWDLDIAEAACLAGMNNAPAYNNPIDNIENNNTRREYCLRKMFENGAISEQEYKNAVTEELAIAGNFNYSTQTEYEEEMEEQGITDWYLDAAINEAESIIMEETGKTAEQAREDLRNGGYTVYTAVDINMQQQLEKAMQDPSNFTTYEMDDDEDTLLSAFAVLDYNGTVKAVVGSRDEKTESRCYDQAVQGTRSPGSCIKPIASYAPALDKDMFMWSSFYEDKGIEIETENGLEPWPVNYSEWGDETNWSYNKYFPWQMLMRSLNTMPAQLVREMSTDYSYSFLRDKLDITTLQPADNDNSAMAVGGMTDGLHLEELVAAYMIFGNGGKKYNITHLYKMEDENGNVIYEQNDGYKQAVTPETAYIMNRMMQNVINDSVGTGREAKLSKTDLVGKTGTTTNWQDLNFVGCTPDYVSGVWIGYEDNQKIPTNDYQNIAAIWKNVFGDIAENEPHHSFDDEGCFPMPAGVEKLTYCAKSGQLASRGCSDRKEGYYKTTNKPDYCYLGY